VEGKFGIGKIKYRLDRVMAKLKDTSEKKCNRKKDDSKQEIRLDNRTIAVSSHFFEDTAIFLQ